MFLLRFKNFPQNFLSPLFALLFTYMAGLVVGLYWHPRTTIIVIIVLLSLVSSSYALLKKLTALSALAIFFGLFLVGVLI